MIGSQPYCTAGAVVEAQFAPCFAASFSNATRKLLKDDQSADRTVFVRSAKSNNPLFGRWSTRIAFMLVASVLVLPTLANAKGTGTGSGFSQSQSRSNAGSAEQNDSDIQELGLAKPVERDLEGGQHHIYQVALAGGQFLHAVLEPHGIAVTVTLSGPDGKPIMKLAVTAGSSEPLFLVTKEQGTYGMEIRSPEGAAAGSYRVELEELRVATSQDSDRSLALSALAEGEQLHKAGTAESKPKAIDKYEQALSHWRASGDRWGLAEALQRIGLVYVDLSEAQKSFDYLSQALAIERAIGDRTGEAATLNARGSIYHVWGQNEKALDELNRALSLRQALGDRAGEAETLRNIGEIYDQSGDRHKALNYYERGFPLAEAAGDRREEAVTLNNIGVVHDELGDCQMALDYLERALRLERVLGERPYEALTLYSIGQAYDNLGERQKVLDSLSQALPLARAAGDRQGEAYILNDIGRAYDDLGAEQRALDSLNKALPLIRAGGNRAGEAYTLQNIGRVYDHRGEGQKALDYYSQALVLRRTVGNRAGESQTLTSMGRVYFAFGEYQKAMEYLNQGLSLSRSTGNRFAEAFNLNEIGELYLALREKEKALDSYLQALPLARSLGDRRAESNALYGVAQAEREQGNLAEALAQTEAAIKIIESLRTEVLSEDLRAAYFATVQHNYALYIDVLMRMHQLHPHDGNDTKALEVSERARARTLLETLVEAQAGIRQGVDPALLERERSLRQLLKGKEVAQRKLLGSKHTEEQAAALKQEIADVLSRYEEVEGQIREASPRYAALMQPQPLSAPEIQQQLDANTLLLEYALGEEHSYLWAVGPKSLDSFQLPKRTEVEAAARRFYELVTAPNRPVKGETEAQREARLAQAEAQYPQAGAALSKMLLAPIAPLMKGKRLAIVADGVLQYIPFSALPEPPRGKSTNAKDHPTAVNQVSSTPLVVGHEVISLPSASTLAVLRRQIKGRLPAPNIVAVLADPVFDAQDSRVEKAGGSSEAEAQRQSQKTWGTRGAEETQTASLSAYLAEGRLTRSAAEVGLGRGAELHFPRLVFSRRESEDIVAAAPAGKGMMALDFKASLQTATDPELAHYRIVHFATHGLLNSEHPELSGLVLSLVDQQGLPQDGFLQLQDIYNLNLPVDLVVLSACETGLGKDIRGEGLMGLTRGFMYAGAGRVIASLWKVDDVATSELMKRLYHGMLTKGLAPATALRQSQIEMWKQQRWQSPYYWAAFVIQGEWK